MKQDMKPTREIQRLEQPMVGPDGQPFHNPFSFGGGGLLNGGLGPEALKLLGPICAFDYMGAAEYECGAVPKAFQSWGKHREDLIFFHEDIGYVKPGTTGPGTNIRIYVICHRDWREEVMRRIFAYAHPEANDRVLRDPTYFDGWVQQHQHPRYRKSDEGKEWWKRIVGWLEINNDPAYAWFVDTKMAHGLADLFQIRKV